MLVPVGIFQIIKENAPMPQQRLKKQLFQITGPIFVETLLIMLLGFVDIMMLSRLSDSVVASVGIVNQLLVTVSMVFMVAATGASVLCSQYFGAKQAKNFTQSIGVALLFNISIGILTSMIFYFFSKEILLGMDVKVDLLDNANIYLYIVGSCIIFVCLGMTISTVLRSCNMSRYPMYISVVVNICNILGNYTFIFGKFGFPALGVEGAALSTVCSRAVAISLLGYALFKYALKQNVFKVLWPFPWDKLKKMLFIGLPAAGEMLSYSLSQMVIIYFINKLGTDAMAARTYLMNFIMFIFLFALSLAQGSSVVVGQLIGKHQNQAAYVIGRYSIRLAIIVSVSLSALLALCAPFFMPYVTSNQEIITMCLTIFWLDVILEVGRTVNMVGGRMLGATGNPQYPFIVGLVFMWLFATLGGYIFGLVLGFGLIGMWVAFIMDEVSRAAFLWHRWLSKKWKNRGFVE